MSETFPNGRGERVVLQEFGNMGSAAAHLSEWRGYRIIAVVNKTVALVNKAGIDIQHLLKLTET
ncbi:MAG: hypothetical protein RMI49_04025 [Candidatus Caldarchaeum sp.]|nr:hypothetical protein [Candidatus Caldarchaeum sp.]